MWCEIYRSNILRPAFHHPRFIDNEVEALQLMQDTSLYWVWGHWPHPALPASDQDQWAVEGPGEGLVPCAASQHGCPYSALALCTATQADASPESRILYVSWDIAPGQATAPALSWWLHWGFPSKGEKKRVKWGDRSTGIGEGQLSSTQDDSWYGLLINWVSG